MPTIFLHVGFPKTGTSAIQSFLRLNRKALKDKGVLYPLSGDTSYAGQAGLAFAAKKMIQKPFNILKKEIEDSGCQTVLISSEYFFMLESQAIGFLKECLKEYEVKVVVYLRRQDARIESGYLQVLRDSEFRFSGTIDEYIKYLEKFPRRTDYYKFIEPWAGNFGQEAIKVMVYEEEKRELIQSFFKLCSLAIPSEAVSVKDDVNVAYKPIVNRFLRQVNRIPMPISIHLKIIGGLNFLTKHLLGSGSVSGHQLLNDKRREEIVRHYSESNARVASEFLGRNDGRLFKDST